MSDTPKVPSSPAVHEEPACGSRRTFIQAAGMAAVAAALTSCKNLSTEEFLQRNFRELDKKELADIIARLEKE